MFSSDSGIAAPKNGVGVPAAIAAPAPFMKAAPGAPATAAEPAPGYTEVRPIALVLGGLGIAVLAAAIGAFAGNYMASQKASKKMENGDSYKDIQPLTAEE